MEKTQRTVHFRDRQSAWKPGGDRRRRTKTREYIYNPVFDDASMEEAILAPMPDAEGGTRDKKSLLTHEQATHLFRQMNFLKYRASQLRALGEAGLERAAALMAQADEIRNLIIEANIRLVVNTVKWMADRQHPLQELVSDGNESLRRAVDGYNYAFGWAFSTYATTAIRRNLPNDVRKENYRRSRERTNSDGVLDSVPDTRPSAEASASYLADVDDTLAELMRHLDPRERQIVKMRMAGKTLEECGQHFGLTKERVRQLEARGMAKLQEVAVGLDMPERPESELED